LKVECSFSVIKGTQHNNDLSKQRNDDARFFVLIVLHVFLCCGHHWFQQADTDPDPAFYVNAVPDIRIRVLDDRVLYNFIGEKVNILGSKIVAYLFLGLHEERLSYRRSLQPSKQYISLLFSLFFMGQIRIQPTKIDADPC
jgi:hypothetical protein